MRLLSAVLFFSISGFVHGQIIANGGFDDGKEPWRLSVQAEAQASFDVEESGLQTADRCMRISIARPSLPQHVQFSQNIPAGKLPTGAVCTLSFRAKADPPRSVNVRLLNAESPWGNLGLQEAAVLGAEWTAFEMRFAVGQCSQAFAKLVFFLGADAGEVWIDDVRLSLFEPKPLDADGPALETGAWRLEFAASGAVARLRSKPGGADLLRGYSGGPVYRLTLAGPSGSRTLTDADSGGPRWSEFAESVEIRFDHEGLAVRLEARIEQGGVAFRSRVENTGAEAVTAIAYPILDSPAAIGASAEDDVILFPLFDGGIAENPPKAFEKAPSLDGHYPGPLSCQVAAHCDADQGLAFMTLDSTGLPKRFRVERAAGFAWTFEHFFPTLPGESAAAGYPTLVRPYGAGGWEAAAELYREWADGQPFRSRTIAERPDMPGWLKRGAVVTQYMVAGRGPERQNSAGQNPARLRANLESLAAEYATPPVANIRNWERWGVWTGQEYWPPYPSLDEFRAHSEAARAGGGRGMVMLSGYRWTLEKKTPEGGVYDSTERYEAQVKPWVVRDPATGQPALRSSAKENDWHGSRFVALCRATEFAKQTIVETARRCVEAGWPVIHFDQEVSGNYLNSVCGAADHGHPPGHGRWVHEAMSDLYDRLRAACAPLDPDFALSMEEPNELYVQQLNLCQSRPYGLTTEWPVRVPMTRSVPLFLFLYHDCLMGWAAFYPWRSGGHPEYMLAKGFAIGMTPGITPASPIPGDAANAAYRETMARFMRAYSTYANEYLVAGRMLRSLPLDLPSRTLDLGQYGETTVAAVSHGAWGLADGRIGVVFANPEPEAHAIEANWSDIQGAPRSAAAFWITPEGETAVAPDAAGRLRATVPPRTLALLEIR